MVLPNTRFRTARQWASISLVARQRMVTTNRFGSSDTYGTVNLFVSDATYPATVTGSTTLVVNGTGPATLTASVEGGAGNGSRIIEIRRNGLFLMQANANGSGNWTHSGAFTFQDGDQITMVVTGHTGVGRHLSAGTYIDINPAA